MKNLSFLIIICFLFLPRFVSASDEERIPDRTYEFEINASIGFSNSTLTTSEIFQKTLVLNLDELTDGLKINLGMGAVPLSFKYNSGRGWGFGLSTGVDAVGILGLSGDMLSFKMTEDSKSDLGGAAFGYIDINAFYQFREFKIKFKPAIYYPFVYVKSDISYTNNSENQLTQLYIKMEIPVFTAFTQGSAYVGMDFCAGMEYPLSEKLGIREKYPILDFDIGIDFVNIPIFPSTMRNFLMTSAEIGNSVPLSIEELLSDLKFETASFPGEGNEKVFRPFKMLLWADWRPFLGEHPISIIPTIGFSVGQFYVEPAAIEAGLKARLDLSNRYIFTLGIGYYDRLWINSLDVTLNFRAVELNIGGDLRGSNFVQSWSGYGFGLRVGLKFGW